MGSLIARKINPIILKLNDKLIELQRKKISLEMVIIFVIFLKKVRCLKTNSY